MAIQFKEDLRGINGWLVLVAIGVVISPFRLAFGIVPAYLPLFRDGIWRVLITPGTDAYHPLWAPLLAMEITYNLAMFVTLLWMLWLFFSKHHLFPRVYILVLAAPLLFMPLDAWLVGIVIPGELFFDETTAREFLKSILGAAIWIPYALKSERVKATFTREKPVASEIETPEIASSETE